MAEESKTKSQLFWERHKDDPEYIERNRQQRKESYYKNAEKERAAALERYYRRKERLAQENPDAPKKKIGRPRKIPEPIVDE